ncbi:MAG TPA: hypothetical protein VM782_04135 [Stellaceae bacterium]|nr:hypothetical protein [Stellaceae bacterium]
MTFEVAERNHFPVSIGKGKFGRWLRRGRRDKLTELYIICVVCIRGEAERWGDRQQHCRDEEDDTTRRG